MMKTDLLTRQLQACERAAAQPALLSPEDRVAVGRDFDPSKSPINGMRHPPHGNMSGWYIWSGERLEEDPDYFHVICYEHLAAKDWTWVQYLALPAGWRFLAAPGQEDLWFDETLFKI